MKKIIILSIAFVVLASGIVYSVQNNKNGPIQNNEKDTEPNEFVQCLADAGVVIYGSATCPACAQLVASLGGYDAIEPIYVECTKEGQRCQREMQTNYVPEIQIKGALYNGSRAPEALADETGCEL